MANVIKHKRGSGSDPVASDLVVGEVAIRTDVGKLFTKMDNGTVAEIAGGGSDIAINTLSSSSATGGGSATFNGSAYRFTLSAPPNVSAAQLLVSINGVIQKPVAGTGQPSEGFSVDGTDIILGDAPATGSDFFILTFKSLGVSEPADNSVTSAKIVDGAIVNADINASAAIDGSKISPDFGSQNITTTGFINTGIATISGTNPRITLNDTNNENDFAVQNNNGNFQIVDIDESNRVGFQMGSDGNTLLGGNVTMSGKIFLQEKIEHTGDSDTFIRFPTDNAVAIQAGGTERFRVSDHVDVIGNLDVSAGLDVTGAITGTGDLTIDTNTLHVDSSNNRVGIGTSSPSRKLHLVGSNPMVLIEGSGGNGRQYALASSDDTTGAAVDGGNAGTFAIYDDTANAARLVINSSGNVGIGTTSPDTLLHLSGADTAVIRLENTDTTLGTDQIIGGIEFEKQDATGAGVGIAGAIRLKSMSSVGQAASMFFSTSNSSGNDQTRMTLDFDGKVGIGTTSPSQHLVVSGTGSQYIAVTSTDSGNTGVLFGDSDIDAGFVLYANSDDSLRIGTGGANERMRIDSAGSVIIGDDASDKANGNFNDLVVGKADSTTETHGITIVCGNAATNGGIAFSDGSNGGADAYRGMISYQHNDNHMQFRTNAVERMRIASDGNVGIGKSSTSLDIDGSIFFGNGQQLQIVQSGSGGKAMNIRRRTHVGTLIQFDRLSGSAVGSISCNNTSTSYNTSSDYRLKENVVTLPDAITRLKTLKPYRFNFIADKTVTVDGFLAHEVTAVPEAITGTKDAVVTQEMIDNEEYEKEQLGDIIPQSIDQAKLVPLLVAALQEAIGRIEVLEAK